MLKYLKYTACTVLCLLTVGSMLWGSHMMWLPLLFTLVVAVFGDAFLPEDQASETFGQTWILNALLYANLPLLFIAYSLFIWHVAPGDWLSFGAWCQNTLGLELLKAKAQTSLLDKAGAFLGLGLVFGVAGTNVAHELVHRTWSTSAQEVGRWLLAFTWDGAFAIEHVYGHHRRVATFEDPASARRGENFFQFFFRSLLGGNRSAWEIERRFLQRNGHSVWSYHNRLIRAWSYSAALALLAFWAAGWTGILLQIVLGLYGKAYLECVNFVEHYGLIRVPKTPVQFRHSWNSNAAISSWFLYNLPRHSHHHETGHIPFWRLKAQETAPSLPFGYMTMILIALVPPLHRKVMAPCLEAWDQQYATPEERQLLQSGPMRSAIRLVPSEGE